MDTAVFFDKGHESGMEDVELANSDTGIVAGFYA